MCLAALGGHGALIGERWTAELRMSARESVSDLEEEMFIGDGTDELETNGQTGGREAAGDGDGGDACEIGRTVWAKEQGAGGMVLIANQDGFLIDERGGDGSGGYDEGVNAGVCHR